MSTISNSRIKSSSIMFTDIVGYSKMVGNNEKLALQLLDKHNKMITGSIQKFNGTGVKFIGDAVFAEFEKPGEASHCAVNIQHKLMLVK